MKKLAKIGFVGLLVLILVVPSQAQERLSLEECIDIATERNIQLRQAYNTRDAAEVGYRYSIYNYLPNLNMSVDYTWQFGTTFSQATFTREEDATIGFSRPGIATSLDVFTGFKRQNDRLKAGADLAATTFSIEKMGNELAKNIVLAYLVVVFDEENIKLAKSRRELVEKQLGRTEKQVEAGLMTQGDLFQIKSQLATEKLTELNAENQRQKDLLTLLQTMGAERMQDYELVRPNPANFTIDPVIPERDKVYEYASQNMPEIKEQEQRVLASEYAWKSSKSGLYPKLSLTAGIGSNYSSQGVLLTQPGQLFPSLVDTGYFPQLNLNQNSYAGVTMTIPIFNRMQVRGLMESQRVQMLNTQLEKENQELILYKTIQQAHLDVVASQAKYKATEEQVIATEEALAYAQKRFDAGVIDFVSFMEILNNKTRADSELLQAKYDFILKMKILDLYQGKPLTFE